MFFFFFFLILIRSAFSYTKLTQIDEQGIGLVTITLGVEDAKPNLTCRNPKKVLLGLDLLTL